LGSDATATVNQVVIKSNAAVGGNGASGGDGLGGGSYVASEASLGVFDSVIELNIARKGEGENGGSNGEGIGGGVYKLGTFTDQTHTVIISNDASTSGDNVGP
jgi:hypothetical protein